MLFLYFQKYQHSSGKKRNNYETPPQHPDSLPVPGSGNFGEEDHPGYTLRCFFVFVLRLVNKVVMKDIEGLPNWTEIKDNQINMPDYLDPLFHKLGMQLRFHTISGKEEKLTICHMVRIAEEFFYLQNHSELKNKL